MGLIYGVSISAEVSFILSQFTHLTDVQTDRWTDILVMAKTALHRCSTVKIKSSVCKANEWQNTYGK